MSRGVGLGLCCPACGDVDTGVVDSRAYLKGIRRRRDCGKCGHRFSTLEATLDIRKGPQGLLTGARFLDLVGAIDKLPEHKREIVLTLIAAFVADEADREPLEGR